MKLICLSYQNCQKSCKIILINNNKLFYCSKNNYSIFLLSHSEEDKTFTKEKEVYPITSKEKSESVLLLAVKNQENDFLHTDSTKCKEKASPAKLNVLNIFKNRKTLNPTYNSAIFYFRRFHVYK